MEDTDIKMQQVLSDSLDAKLSIVTKLIKIAIDKGFKLSSLNVISLDLIDKLRELNRLRNGFSHTGAMSEEQAKKFILKYQADVLSVLQSCRDLRLVKLIKYKKSEGKITEIRCEVFNGHSMNRKYEKFSLAKEDLDKCTDYLEPNTILVNINNHIFSISPFFHFKPTVSGHQTKLCCYKKKKGETPNQKFIYEVIGDALEMDLDSTDFKIVIEDIRNLLPDLSGRSGD
ncbi:hypothetical protein [Nostoc sp.]|uniref:hypothetical protein n=1 Tax=Nostoc sp. TaxID=1180 RepID=UPI002FFD2F41